MKETYRDINISFRFEGYTIDVLNIIFENFDRTIPLHSHGKRCYEIHYIADGYGKLSADGQIYAVMPDTLFVTGPGVEHAQIPLLQDPMQEYCIYLRVQGHPRLEAEESVMECFLNRTFWFGKDTQNIKETVKHLFEELRGHATGYRKQTELLLQQLLIQMIRNYEKETAKGLEKKQLRLEQKNRDIGRTLVIEEYFLYEYRNPSLRELAVRLGLSERQTQRMLQVYYGKNFQQKKVEARMSAAVILLRDRDKRISEIAELLGYSSLEHFSTEFRKYYAVSPSGYRAGAEKRIYY